MSTEAQNQEQGILAVEAKPGAAIHISDGRGKEFWQGTDATELSVAPGLYAIRWLSLGARERKLVEVLPGETTRVEPAQRAEASARDAATTAISEVPMSLQFLYATKRSDKSDLVVSVEGPSDLPVNEILSSICLINGADREVEPSPDLKIGSPVGARSWSEVTSGRYRLRYRANSGDLLDQTIPVFQDRRTIVRLFVSQATLVVPEGDRFTNTKTLGVDPARSIIATILANRSRDEMYEGLRLAELLLRDLARGTGSLSDAFTARLDDPRTDPLLKVYGAMVVINCLERDLAPAVDEPFPNGARAAEVYKQRWLAIARRWLAHSRRGGMPPDATAGLWQIEQMGFRDDEMKAGAQRSIKMPPMLECAWRWAVARSTVDRQALEGFASIRAAARSAGGTTPFLCWQASAAKAINRPGAAPSTEALDRMVQQVARKMGELRKRDPGRTPRSMLPNGVPAEAGAIALRAEEMVAERERRKSKPGYESLSGELAVSLAFPLAALGVRLEQTIALLDQASDRSVESPAESRRSFSGRDAPGWTTKVRHQDDPNLGRFGGRSADRGFRLSARFNKSKSSKNWIAIHLTIAGPAIDGEKAVLYLHDSFKPARREVEFEDGEARLKVTAWGGFTVGAWIPAQQIQLELNLATLDSAPRIIRER